MTRTAFIIGATGMAGGHLARHLIEAGGWRVLTLSRGHVRIAGAEGHISVDLSNRSATLTALGKLTGVSHVFYCTWSPQPSEAENCAINRAMIRNTLDGLAAAPTVHVALVTGLKHYLGPFEAYGAGRPYTPFQEDQPRLPGPNFYYDQEDELFQAAEQQGFTWSVHRAHTMVGYALGNAMNMAVTLAIYASICRQTGRPFLFPGSATQLRSVTDVTDARLLARHLAWAATEPRAANTPFNVVNGDLFRWERMWARIAAYFGLEPAPYPGRPTPLQTQMADIDPIWDTMVIQHGLTPIAPSRVASWWHSDADLGRELECFTDMRNSRERGFLDWQHSEASFLDVFDRLISERTIPDFRSEQFADGTRSLESEPDMLGRSSRNDAGPKARGFEVEPI